MVGKTLLTPFIPMQGKLNYEYVHSCGKHLIARIAMNNPEGTWITEGVQHFVEERPATYCPECGELLPTNPDAVTKDTAGQPSLFIWPEDA